MRRLFTETVGIPVMLEDSTAPVGFVKDLVIDQETGRLAAFVLPRGHAISTSEVVEWDDYIVVRDEDSIGELEELVRVSRLVERQHRIFGKKVVTEDGEDLGRGYDLRYGANGVSTDSCSQIFSTFPTRRKIDRAQAHHRDNRRGRCC
jgi:uncharacterized protein YrrD